MFAWNAHGIPTGAGLVTSCCLRDAKKWCKRDLVHSLSMTSKLYACFQSFSNAFCQGGNAYCNFSAVSALKRTVEINSQSRSSSVVVTGSYFWGRFLQSAKACCGTSRPAFTDLL
jgi:hypothetical protein